MSTVISTEVEGFDYLRAIANALVPVWNLREVVVDTWS
jgi:hypothetical protein